MTRLEKRVIDDIIFGIGVDSMNRFPTFLSVKKNLTPALYWYGLGSAYISSDNLYIYRNQVRRCFSSKLPERENVMTTRERKKIESLPDTLTIYRGMTVLEAESERYGVSWTMSLKVAKFFRDIYRRNYSTNGLSRTIVSLNIDKKDIVAHFNGRKEKEIIFLGNSLK